MQRLKQTEAAELLGLAPRTLQRRGDIPRNGDGTYNGRELVAWVAEQAKAEAIAEQDESLGTPSDSPALERMRDMKAQLYALELSERQRKVVPAEVLRLFMSHTAMCLRRFGDLLRRDGAHDYVVQLNDTIDDISRRVEHDLDAGLSRGLEGGAGPIPSTGDDTEATKPKRVRRARDRPGDGPVSGPKVSR